MADSSQRTREETPDLGATSDHTPLTPGSAVPLPGPSGPRYRLAEELARGGMGIIYRAIDETLGREVAVKVLQEKFMPDSGTTRRFADEARIAARLQHPAIPPVHDVGTLPDGRPFLAMKLINGSTLALLLQGRPDPAHERGQFIAVFEQVCQALAYAHSHQVIHRDLKPSNIMVGAFGEVQVMDWGLAKELRIADCGLRIEEEQSPIPDPSSVNPQSAIRNSQSTRTHTGSVLGTPAFMPPEQAVGAVGKVDARSDVFGLGAILAVILTRKPPFAAATPETTRIKAAQGDVAECFSRLDACGADPDLVALCKRCLAPRPEDRPSDAAEVAKAVAALRAAADERARRAELERVKAEEEARSAQAQAAEQRKRRRAQLALAAALVLLLLGGGAFAWWHDRQTTERRAEARDRERQANEGVDAALKLVPDLRKQYRFAAAKKTLDQAALLANGGAPDRLAEVEQAQRDLAFVVQLDDIRYRKWIWLTDEGKGKFNLKIAAPQYHRAFAERDLDLTALDPAQAAQRIAASAVKAELVAAVDDWSLHEPEPAMRDRLLDVARRADPGPWTDRLRDRAVRTDRGALARLANEVVSSGASSAARSVLATLMWGAGLNPAPMLTAARAEYPGEFELAFALGLWYIKTGRDDLLIGPYEAARALRPDNAAVWINLGNALRSKGQLDEAIACYQQANALDPKLAATAQANLGIALYGKGQLDEAIARYKKAIALDPRYAAAHNGLGAALHDRGQVDEAIACYHKALALDGQLATAHYNLGNSLSRKGQLDDAITSYQRALALDPKFAMAHTNLGSALSRKGREDEAIACFKEAIALDPKLATAHYSLGLAHQRKGQADEAIARYREAIRLQPGYAEAHCNLGGLLREQGDYAAAEQSYRKGHELGSRRPGWRYPSAQWLARAKHELALSRRLPALLRGEDKPKDNAERLAFAQIASTLKRFAAATRLFAEALESDPKLGDDRQTAYRYDGACAASLAAAGLGKDEPPLDDAAKAKLRRQALDWLQAELAVWAKLLESGPREARPHIVLTLNHWRKDTDLAGIRDKSALAGLPAEEQKACTRLWADVTALLKKAEEKAK
jgi:predicted ribosomally synthesized peptide with SipW-like signal peptide